MNTSDIDQMLAEKGNLCISIVVPTHRYSRERIQDPKTVYKAVEKVNICCRTALGPGTPFNRLKQNLKLFAKTLTMSDCRMDLM